MLEKKYFEIGKISYSNNHKYIGSFFKLDELNYDRIKEVIESVLKDKQKFENVKDKFLYHLIETTEDYSKYYSLSILYDIKQTIIFTLVYDTKVPTVLPIYLYKPEIFKSDFEKTL